MQLKILFKEVRKNNCQLALETARTVPKYNIFNVCYHSISYRRIQNTIQEQIFLVWSTETKPLTHKLREYGGGERSYMTIQIKIMGKCNVSSYSTSTPFICKKRSNFESTVHDTANPSRCPLVSEYPLSLAFMTLVTQYCSQIIFHYVLTMVPMSSWLWGGAFGITHASSIMYNFHKRARQADGFAKSWT